MVIKITHKVCGMPFTAVAENIAQAYEYIQAIIKAESLNFPNQQESLSEYMAELARFKDGKLLKTENHSFKIEVGRTHPESHRCPAGRRRNHRQDVRGRRRILRWLD